MNEWFYLNSVLYRSSLWLCHKLFTLVKLHLWFSLWLFHFFLGIKDHTCITFFIRYTNQNLLNYEDVSKWKTCFILNYIVCVPLHGQYLCFRKCWDMYCIFKKNCWYFCLQILNRSQSFHKMSIWILRVNFPWVNANNNSLIFQFLNLSGTDANLWNAIIPRND